MENLSTQRRFRGIVPLLLGCIVAIILQDLSVLGNYKVILKDGKTVEARTRPISMEGQYRFTSVEGKAFVLPLGQVDLKATEQANLAQSPAQHSAKRYTNEDLAAVGSSASTQEKSHPSAQEENPAKEGSPVIKTAPVENGRDETYWRKRAKTLKDKIAAVDKQIEDLNQKLQEKKGEGIAVGMGTYTPYMVAGLNNLQSQVSAMQREKERLQKEYSDLEEEARKAGVMPGWLR